jgi:hypothetical protein
MNPPLLSRPFPGPVGRALPGALLLAACAWWAAGRPALHLFAENASRTDTAEVLATYVVDTGCGTLVIPEPAAAPART